MTTLETTHDLNAAGYGAGELARLVRDGRFERVRRGVYADADPSLDRTAAHRRLVQATVPQCGDDAVVSHVSAAVMHGLEVPRRRLHQVHLTRDAAGGGRNRRRLWVHGLRLDACDVENVDGLRVTTRARTVLDLACLLPPCESVAVGDSALRAGCTSVDVADAASRAGRRLGLPAARRALGLLDARSESAGESFSRVVLHDLGLPPPVLQHEVFDTSLRLVGRCDFSWPEWRTLAEFDGLIKYGRGLNPGDDLEQVLVAEKLREDALRDLGLEVVRWIWADLYTPTTVAARLARAFARGRTRSTLPTTA